MPRFKDLTGNRYHNLTVECQVGRTRSGGVIWQCKCDCGVKKEFSSDHLTRKKNPVKSCGCIRKALVGEGHPQWEGHGDISGGWWRDHVIRSAMGSKSGKSTRKPVPLTITIEDAWNLFLKQNRKCALSGLDIQINKTAIYNTASLDRIDSSKGYEPNNVQWVHKHINLMKNKFDQEYFIKLCSLVGACEI
jgi:hypothetical protein